MVKRVTIRVDKVVEHSHEEALADVRLVQPGGQQETKSTVPAPARKEFEWDDPVHFDVEEVPEEVTISVRALLGHAGTPEVLGFGTVHVKKALAHGVHRQAVRVPLGRHHRPNTESDQVIEEHTGDADVVIELEE